MEILGRGFEAEKSMALLLVKVSSKANLAKLSCRKKKITHVKKLHCVTVSHLKSEEDVNKE